MTEGRCPHCTQTKPLDKNGKLVEHISLNGLDCPGGGEAIRRCEHTIDNDRTGYRLTLWLESDNDVICNFDVRNRIENRSDAVDEVVAYGHVKWDGCLNIMLDEPSTQGRHHRVMHHGCGPGEWHRLLLTLGGLYDAAWDMFDTHRPKDDDRNVADWEKGDDDESHLFPMGRP